MFDEIKLDLQAFAKRVYDSILYQSTFYNFLNPNYIGTLRQTGAPVIEIAKRYNKEVKSIHVEKENKISREISFLEENIFRADKKVFENET